MDIGVNMLTENELKELAEIRKQVAALQERYDRILSGSRAGTSGKTCAQGATASAGTASAGPPADASSANSPVAPGAPANSTPAADAACDLVDAVKRIVAAAGAPLGFNEIYERLEKAGVPLPKDKPKLLLRRILYNRKMFRTEQGRFTAV